MNYLKITFLVLFSFSIQSCQTSEKPTLQNVDVLPNKQRAQYESFGNNWVISSQGVAATKAGEWVYSKGGNIFDAAVAISLAIGVERPQSTGIGGGGFALVFDNKSKSVKALDFREKAPHAADEKMFLDESGNPIPDLSLTGYKAIATPGLIRGLAELHRQFGKLPFKDLFTPAIELAEKGFPVYPALHDAIDKEQGRLAKFQATRKIFLDQNHKPWPIGHTFKQLDLAKTLKWIAKNGEDGFYEGRIVKSIHQEMKKNGGLIIDKDLYNYNVKWRKPVHSDFLGYDIFSMPPPSSGGTHVIEILNILEPIEIDPSEFQSAFAVHHTTQAMQMAFADRAQYMGDSDFAEIPTKELTSKKYSDFLREQMKSDTTLAPNLLPFKQRESKETTHFTIMDKEGNVVSSTQTINGPFGSAVVIPNTGILMNNEMDDFAASVGSSNYFGAIGGKNNLIQPMKRPLSSMSPTIVLQNQEPILALGTPSGTRIITCVAETLLNRLKYKLPLWDAITATRYHHQWNPNILQIESPYFSAETEAELTKIGYAIHHESLNCKIQATERILNPENSEVKINLHGVSDPREEGSSIGL